VLNGAAGISWRARLSSGTFSTMVGITNNVRVQDARFQELIVAYQNVVLAAQREVEKSGCQEGP